MLDIQSRAQILKVSKPWFFLLPWPKIIQNNLINNHCENKLLDLQLSEISITGPTKCNHPKYPGRGSNSLSTFKLSVVCPDQDISTIIGRIDMKMAPHTNDKSKYPPWSVQHIHSRRQPWRSRKGINLGTTIQYQWKWDYDWYCGGICDWMQLNIVIENAAEIAFKSCSKLKILLLASLTLCPCKTTSDHSGYNHYQLRPKLQCRPTTKDKWKK